ncbi:MAG: SprT family zinc-dependent metalloprotease [Clostridia bacterium]
MQEIRQVFYAHGAIEYILTRKTVKNINIRIKADGLVYVSASLFTTVSVIDDFVKSKGAWILKHKERFKSNIANVLPKEYVSGECFIYLGNHYQLKINQSKEEFVDIGGEYIIVNVKKEDNYNRKKNLMCAWYKNQVKTVFEEVFQSVINKYKIFFNDEYRYKSISMVARWGSCIIQKNTIVLNSKLIFAPKQCIEYVVLHELIHFKVKNHNKEFYRWLDRLMPDWRDRKHILSTQTAKYIRGEIII